MERRHTFPYAVGCLSVAWPEPKYGPARLILEWWFQRGMADVCAIPLFDVPFWIYYRCIDNNSNLFNGLYTGWLRWACTRKTFAHSHPLFVALI